MIKRCSILFLAICCSEGAMGQFHAKTPDPNMAAGAISLERIEAVADWVSLFNGKDLDDWQGDTEKYVVQDGILVCEEGGKILESNCFSKISISGDCRTKWGICSSND